MQKGGSGDWDRPFCVMTINVVECYLITFSVRALPSGRMALST